MIEPYYKDERVTLYQGDCLEILPQLAAGSVNAVITDPPYGVEGGRGGQLKDYRKADYQGFEDTPEYIGNVCVKAIKQCLELAATVVLTPGTRCLTFYPQPDEVGAFYSPAASRIGKFGFQNLHPIFYYGKYKNAGKGALHTVLTLTETAEANGHPCPKPLKAWQWLCDRTVSKGQTILDPFMGSGTTGVAAMNLGCKFIGIELTPYYCEIAKAKILRAQGKPVAMPTRPPRTDTVLPLFTGEAA